MFYYVHFIKNPMLFVFLLPFLSLTPGGQNEISKGTNQKVCVEELRTSDEE